MAEERIICLQIGSHLRDCPLMKNSGHCILDCGCDQLEGIKCNKGLPRTEAIERMAISMFEYERPCCKGEVPIEDVWQYYKNHYIGLAAAAFDGLLEAYRNE